MALGSSLPLTADPCPATRALRETSPVGFATFEELLGRGPSQAKAPISYQELLAVAAAIREYLDHPETVGAFLDQHRPRP
jgi:hypothetical protein